MSGTATGIYCPRLFAPAAFSPGSVSTNFRIPPVNGPPSIAVAAPPVPVASDMITTGAEYPVPALVTEIPVIIPPVTVAEAVAPDPVKYTSSIVTTGAVYPVPPLSIVTLAIFPFGRGLFAQLGYGPK